MIDASKDTILTLAQAAGELPRRRRGRKTSTSTLYRWASAGCRGIRLQTLQIGGSRCTSREALQLFFEQLTMAHESRALGSPPPSMPPMRTAAQRNRAAEEAGRKLAKLGA